MRVLVVAPFPPDPAPEASHALHLSEHLAKAGLAVHVLCKTGSIGPTHSNIVVHPVIEDWTWSDLPRLAGCMRRSQPDVVLLVYLGWTYGHNPMITFLPTICRLVLPDVPCITQFEAVDDKSPGRSIVVRALRKGMAAWGVHPLFGTLLRDSTGIIALSSPHRARLAKHHPGVQDKSVVVPPPPLIRFNLDPPAIARKRAREAIGAAQSDFVLVYWGYIYPGKGVETLLQAFRRVCSQDSNMRLILVGGNLEIPSDVRCRDYFRTVQRLPTHLGIADKVTWTGHFDWDSDKGSQFLHAGDACVLPFDYGVTLNNSSLAAASTHGLPVIGTELPAGREEALEHGRNIYLCRPRDPEMLAEAIELISHATDLRERLRAGTRALARTWYSWDTTTQRLLGVLESAVASRRTLLPFDPAPSGRGSRTIRPVSSHTSPQLRAASPAPRLGPSDTPDDTASPPLVSVIVAVHDVATYVSQCLDSLVNQTLTPIEIIVVDDASSDDSPRILATYASRHPNIHIITSDCNLGLASARNLGLGAAKGRYIAFVDGDDWADVTMCEVMYCRATADDADVLIADAVVLYDDSKTFAPFFDQRIRRELDPRLATAPFACDSDPRILLLEPVAWTKLYKRSFLLAHGLSFESGMNSYEDIIFHFSVLLKAARISLIDTPVVFYRQNRPGQISGRRDRRVFEVFDVFDKIHANFAAWAVSPGVWALLLKVQMRQVDWLLGLRVDAHDKREFLARAARQLRAIPDTALQHYAREASPDESARLRCILRNRLRAYEWLARQRRPLLRRVYRGLRKRSRHILNESWRRSLRMLQGRLARCFRFLARHADDLPAFAKQLQAMQERVYELTTSRALARHGGEPLIEVCRIRDHTILLSHPDKSGLHDAVWRMANDYYLTQTVAFREGDVVIDVGAHVGVIALYLAARYPFVQVYALEPEPTNYECLLRNIELNGLSNVIAIRKALTGDGRPRRLFTSPWDSRWATISVTSAPTRTPFEVVQVESVTLDELFGQYGIRTCRLLKINAQGAIRESLKRFTRSGCVDFLCGEADLRDCSRVMLEMESWRIARQHFWRTVCWEAAVPTYSWIEQRPIECEDAVSARLQDMRPDRARIAPESAPFDSRSAAPAFAASRPHARENRATKRA